MSINTATNANDVIIARLDWFNSATIAQLNLNEFLVNWVLTVAFTQPSGSADTEVFTLTVTNPLNPPGDNVTGLTLTDLGNLTFALNNVIVSDLRYSVQDGAGGAGGPLDTTLTINGGQADWYNSENNWARLYITGDFTYTGGAPPAAIPHPTPLLLLGASLAGVAVWVRRRRRP